MLPWHINNIFIIVFPFQHFIFFYYSILFRGWCYDDTPSAALGIECTGSKERRYRRFFFQINRNEEKSWTRTNRRR